MTTLIPKYDLKMAVLLGHNMWKHYFLVEKEWLEVAKEQPYNWCAIKEEK